MAPVLEKLNKELRGKAIIRFVDVRKYTNFAQNYPISVIPTQVIIDKDGKPKYACYCSKVTEKQVIDAVVIHGAKTVREVNSVTGAMKNSDCKANNPLGICCHSII